MNFSERLLKFRSENNLTQRQMAVFLGVHFNMIYRYENNKSKPLSVNRIAFENKMKEWGKDKNV